MAQAALESGFGQARLAKASCNLVGLWCYTKGCGIVPKHRNPKAHHAIRSFKSIEANLRAYMHTLDTHPAYRAFRQHYDAPLATQIATLDTYSAIKAAYPKRLMRIIKRDHLERFDA